MRFTYAHAIDNRQVPHPCLLETVMVIERLNAAGGRSLNAVRALGRSNPQQVIKFLAGRSGQYAVKTGPVPRIFV